MNDPWDHQLMRQVKANFVEKLVPHSEVLFKSKIDLSDRSRMGDLMPAKGPWTPQKVLFVSLDEFFNRIGWVRTFDFDDWAFSRRRNRSFTMPDLKRPLDHLVRPLGRGDK